ncbi:MAG: EamA family transporter [Spirochaetaceae bacterium]
MTLKGALLLLLTISFTVSGQILMKKGVSLTSNLTLGGALTTPFILIGGFCYIAGFVVWLNVLKVLPLSIAYPSSSVSFILVIFASSMFLGEAVTLFKLIGIGCICLGVFFIGFK